MNNHQKTLGDLFDYASHLLNSISETSRLDAEILISEVCHLQKHHFVTDRQKLCSPEMVEKVEALLQRRINGEPIAYITGKRWFYKHQFIVTPAVLVPRPETELLVEWVVNYHKTTPLNSLLDLCTGSGCIGISISNEIHPQTTLLSDISQEALEVANENIRAIAQKKIITTQSDLFENISGRYDVITVNPPYLTDSDMKQRDSSVLCEPKMALDGGKNGTVLIEIILHNAAKFLNKNGILIIEIGLGQLQHITPLIPAELELTEIIKDYAKIERHLVFSLVSS